jgi:hypothetical protein
MMSDRGLPRDLIDVHAASGMFTGPELIALARHVLQEEFSLESLRDRLEYGAAVPDEQYARYGCPASGSLA